MDGAGRVNLYFKNKYYYDFPKKVKWKRVLNYARKSHFHLTKRFSPKVLFFRCNSICRNSYIKEKYHLDYMHIMNIHIVYRTRLKNCENNFR